MRLCWLLPVLVGLLLSACDTTDPSPPAENEIVVQGFLYADPATDSIRLTRAVPLDSTGTTPPPVPNATVTLHKENATYTFASDDAGSGLYTYPGDDLTVDAGNRFLLDIAHEDTRITAETTVPEPPTGVDLSGTVLEAPDFSGIPGDIGSGRTTLSVRWTNPNDALHFVVVESLVEDDPEFIFPDEIRERFDGFQFVTRPTTATSYTISLAQLDVLGPHRLTVYRINEEYAALYENQTQDSRDLNEPPSNVNGGLGVFSAFNGTSVTFEVVRQ